MNTKLKKHLLVFHSLPYSYWVAAVSKENTADPVLTKSQVVQKAKRASEVAKSSNLLPWALTLLAK